MFCCHLSIYRKYIKNTSHNQKQWNTIFLILQKIIKIIFDCIQFNRYNLLKKFIIKLKIILTINFKVAILVDLNCKYDY